MRKIVWLAGALLLGCGGSSSDDDGKNADTCRATLLTDSAPWLHHILPDPAGGYVGVGNAAPGANNAFYRLDDRFQIQREVRLPNPGDAPRGFWRWGSRYVIGGSLDLTVVDANGEQLASRTITTSAHFSTGVHGVVPRENNLLVLKSSHDEGLRLDEMDERLETIRSSPGQLEVCCDISLHGIPGKAFITGKLSGLAGPLWHYPIHSELEVGAERQLLGEGTEHMSFATATSQGHPIVAARGADDAVMLRRFSGAGGITLPSSSSFVSIRPGAERILVYDNPLDNSVDQPVRVWSVAADYSEVRGPFTYGRSVDVVWVEETKENSFRVLAHRHGGGNYDELWLYEGRGCTDADWDLTNQ